MNMDVNKYVVSCENTCLNKTIDLRCSRALLVGYSTFNCINNCLIIYVHISLISGIAGMVKIKPDGNRDADYTIYDFKGDDFEVSKHNCLKNICKDFKDINY